MRCETHYEEIRFVCRADNCYFLPLCQTCHEDHSRKHSSTDILPISRAIAFASNHLERQKEVIDDLLQPFTKRKELSQRIDNQKRQLRKERDRLVKYIDDYIEQEISLLTRENSSINFTQADRQLESDLEEKSREIDNILDEYRRKAPVLQKALNFSLERFMEGLGKSRNNLYGTTSFRYYSSLKHEIMLNKLELTSESSTTKPFRKIMNESPLYFLIDPQLATSPYLFNFNTRKQQIELYNAAEQEWMNFHANNTGIIEKGCGVHDPLKNRFYWIGGIQGSRKAKTILVFSLDEVEKEKRWKEYSLNTARSSCMATIVKAKSRDGQQRRAILVVGGVGQKEEILKSCELIDLEPGSNKVFNFGETNFAVFSGSLVVFNNSTILRVGGLSKNNSVIEVVQKLDFQEAFLQLERGDKVMRWSYIELELPKGEYLSRPKLFYANQAAIQINPNEVLIFGGLDAGLKGATETYLLGLEEFSAFRREVRERNALKQQKFSVRWVNEKPLITGDDFGGLKPTIWKERLYTLQNMGKGETYGDQKRLLEFDMYQWYETENVLPE